MKSSRRGILTLTLAIAVALIVFGYRSNLQIEPADAVLSSYDSNAVCTSPPLPPNEFAKWDYCVAGPLPTEEGLVVFRLEARGAPFECQGFVARWRNDSALKDEAFFAFVPQGGQKVGLRAFHASATGSYSLRILALGDWSARAWHFGAEGLQVADDEPLPLAIEGSVSNVSRGMNFRRGGVTFIITAGDPYPVQTPLGCPQHTVAARFLGMPSFSSCPNDGNFTVRLLDKDGVEVERLADSCSSYSETRTAFIRQPGVYLLDVEASSQWSILVRPDETLID